MVELREHDAMICRACGNEERASEGLSVRGLRNVHLRHLHDEWRRPLRECSQARRRVGRHRRDGPDGT